MNRSIIYIALGLGSFCTSVLQGAEEVAVEASKNSNKDRFGGREIHVVEGKSTRLKKAKSNKSTTSKKKEPTTSQSPAKVVSESSKDTTKSKKSASGKAKTKVAEKASKTKTKDVPNTKKEITETKSEVVPSTPLKSEPSEKASSLKQDAVPSAIKETEKEPENKKSLKNKAAANSEPEKTDTKTEPKATTPPALDLSSMKDSLKASIKESLAEILAESGLHKTLIQPKQTPKNTVSVPSELTKSKERRVSGDSDNPIIDLTKITTVNPMMLADGDPADLLPWKDGDYYHFAKNQSLKELVRSFCSSQSVDVIVSDAVNDVVNGKFSNVSSRQFWKDIVNAYGLVWFYDGSLLYVYKSSEIQSKVLQMGRDEMRTLIRVITQLAYLSSNINFRPMETAGILVVSGPPKLMEMLEELISKVVIERVSDVFDIRTFPLKHAWAYDMSVSYRGGNMNIPGVATMLQQIIGSLPGPVGEANLGMNIGKDPSPSSATPLDAMVGPAEARRAQNKEAKEESSESSSKDGEKPSNVGDIFITYDTRLNAVIVKAKHQDMHFIEQIIEQLDVPREAIRIDVAVVDISRAGTMSIGALFNTSVHRGNVTFTSDFSKSDLGAHLSVDLGKLFRNFGFNETLDILEDIGNGQTLTRSSVITLDNIAAVIDKSQTVYVKVEGKKAGDLFDVSVSTKLVVVPHIIPGVFNEKGAPKIKLLIDVSDGNFTQDPTNTGGATEPKTDTNTVNTEASIYVGQSLFIGGYFHEKHAKSSKGVPFLKDIPLLGHLFKSSGNENRVMERVYIITPTLVDTMDSELGTYDRFFQDSRLSGEETLTPDEFNLTKPYTPKKEQYAAATYDRLGKEKRWEDIEKKLSRFSTKDANTQSPHNWRSKRTSTWSR